MIVVTGSLGFIGSVVIGTLNQAGIDNLILVDDFSKTQKNNNIANKKYLQKIERSEFIEWFSQNNLKIDYLIHIGARTDTTEFNTAIFDALNLNYTKALWKICAQKQIPMIYASSAATYGDGAFGYVDDHKIVADLKPLNPYGESKNNFDKWALTQTAQPPHWHGLKFFNVYGPNEYHKCRMASVIMHAFNQIEETGSMKLFKSHRPDFNNGEQLRDFVYVKDVASVILWLMKSQPESGLYNLGTGKARSFLDLACNTFKAMNRTENIVFVDTPDDIRDKYQYFTEASMNKLWTAGYGTKFHDLEEGVEDYVKNYLSKKSFF